MKEKLIAIGGGIARHLLGGAGFVALFGKTPALMIGDEDASRLIGAVMALVALTWSIWRKMSGGAPAEAKTLEQ